MDDEMRAAIAPCHAGESTDGQIAEIESLLVTLAMAHRNEARPATDRVPTSGADRLASL